MIKKSRFEVQKTKIFFIEEPDKLCEVRAIFMLKGQNG
jgi:hypothetical protein